MTPTQPHPPNHADPTFVLHDDETITTTLAAPPRRLEHYALLSVFMPPNLVQNSIAGRYVLARCGAQTETERQEQWHIYFRRPLFMASVRTDARTHYATQPSDAATDAPAASICDLLLPLHSADPGYEWLLRLQKGDSLNLLGPLGNGFRRRENARNLLLTGPAGRIAALLPLIEPVLDQSGRVTLLIDAPEPPIQLIASLPLAVEVNVIHGQAQWVEALQPLLPWADQLCGALSQEWAIKLAHEVQTRRFQLEEGFAQVLLDAPLYCGVGACLACVVPLSSGRITRACVHGPVFDLSKL